MRRDSNAPPPTTATTNAGDVYKTVHRRTVTIAITEVFGIMAAPLSAPELPTPALPAALPVDAD